MAARLLGWMVIGAAGVGLLFVAVAPPAAAPTVLVGLAVLLGGLCLAVALIGAGWDIVRVVNARIGPPPTPHLTVLADGSGKAAPTAATPDQALPSAGSTVDDDVRRSQFAQWAGGRDTLSRQGEAIEVAVRALVLNPNDDGLRKDLVASRTWRDAKNWIASVDEFEDHWHVGDRPILGSGFLSRSVGGMRYVPAVPAPKPLWRQNLVRDIAYRLDRLRALNNSDHPSLDGTPPRTPGR